MEFEKENLKRKNDESKDALKSKYLKNQIFQLDLELSQVTDEDDFLGSDYFVSRHSFQSRNNRQ